MMQHPVQSSLQSQNSSVIFISYMFKTFKLCFVPLISYFSGKSLRLMPSFLLKMYQNAFGGRAPSDPLGELTALPQTS